MKNVGIFNKKNCLIVTVMLMSFMAIGSFFDYQISSAIYNQESWFGIFFASFGQLPAMLCFSVGGTLMIKVADRNKKLTLVLSYIFGVLLNAFALFGVAMDPMLYIKEMPLVLSIVIAIVVVVGVDIVMWRLTDTTSREDIKKVIWAFVAIMFIEIMVINIVKIPWGRPRMRMISVQPDAFFQPWWVIGSEMKDKLMAIGVAAEEFKSFPSGHTGNATCSILLCLLPIICSKLKGKENLLFWIGVIFAVVVAFSRLVMGAHFLTDVTVGLTITFVVSMIVTRILWKNR